MTSNAKVRRDSRAGRARLGSPRFRRRLVWAALGAGVLLAVALVILLLPEPKQPSVAPTGKPGSASLAQPVSTRISAARRRAIDKVLDRFIPAGVGRRSMTTAWRLAGPELKAASTLDQWRDGASPLPYYPVAGKTFHDWTTLDSGANHVDFDILVQPRHGSKLGAWGFSGEMVLRGSRWLVNNLYTSATYDLSGRQVGPDTMPGGGGDGGGGSSEPVRAVLGAGWLIAIIAGIGGLLVLTPSSLLLGLYVRDRRLRQHIGRQPLPPLPLRVSARGRRPGGSSRT